MINDVNKCKKFTPTLYSINKIVIYTCDDYKKTSRRQFLTV